MRRVNFEEIVRCAVCGRCRAPEEFPTGVSMCWPCHVAGVVWQSPWFLGADQLRVPVERQEDFTARQSLMRRLLIGYFQRLSFPVTRFTFEGGYFVADASCRYGFRSNERGFDMQFIRARDVPLNAERRLRLWLGDTLTKVITAVEKLDDDLLENIDPLAAGILYFTEVSDYLELTYVTGTLHDEHELRKHLYEIMGVICDSD